MVQAAIDIPKGAIADFCKRNHIVKMALFGSVLRDDFGPESDVDVIVEFHPDHTPGLSFYTLHEDLAGILERKVDLTTYNGISKYIKKKVLREAELIYDGS